ncbi:putative glutamine amidotransferase-like protein C13C5.04 [Pseudocercospora fuligena]|uniref:Putative glutamine amidotransferase-like protein C13C5.04 n=1 Tax=Pseudocercospora fuligena TaxID=685502 RepID=A0A8H6VHP5_9PEZI|nr:putative glutamine amidotransferase-like protein C13C5.04 [Pseudocercospora fuligena]
MSTSVVHTSLIHKAFRLSREDSEDASSDDKASRETVKMLVLETDEPHPETMKHRGRFGEIIDRFFSNAGARHDPPLSIETDMRFIVDDPDNGHHGKVPIAADISEDTTAILITGSMYDAHGDDPWIMATRNLIEGLWRTRPNMKFSGICFGHQILARTLGAKVENTPGEKWELSHTSMNLSPVGKKLFLTDDDTISVHQMHQDQVSTLPSSETTDLLDKDQKVHIWASTKHTKIQGLYIRDRLFTSQGHLGFDETMVRRQIELRQKSGAIKEHNAEEVQYADETAHLEHDGEIVAAAILRFFHGDDHNID